jgi:hypothetical protein
VRRFHRKIGMSGGLLMKQLRRETGLEISAEWVERLRGLCAAAYRRRAESVRPAPGSRELLARVDDAGIPSAIGTSRRMAGTAPNLAALGLGLDRVAVVTRDHTKTALSNPGPLLPPPGVPFRPSGRWSTTAPGAGSPRSGAGRSRSASCAEATARRSRDRPVRSGSMRTRPLSFLRINEIGGIW